VRDAPLSQCVKQRSRHVILAGHVRKSLGAILPCQNLVAHADPLPDSHSNKKVAWLEFYRSSLAGFIQLEWKSEAVSY
jgi:hypothetical protein